MGVFCILSDKWIYSLNVAKKKPSLILKSSPLRYTKYERTRYHCDTTMYQKFRPCNSTLALWQSCYKALDKLVGCPLFSALCPKLFHILLPATFFFFFPGGLGVSSESGGSVWCRSAVGHSRRDSIYAVHSSSSPSFKYSNLHVWAPSGGDIEIECQRAENIKSLSNSILNSALVLKQRCGVAFIVATRAWID